MRDAYKFDSENLKGREFFIPKFRSNGNINLKSGIRGFGLD
jgi:hypothetical protein